MANPTHNFNYFLPEDPSSLLIRTSQFSEAPHIMPIPSEVPWNARAMPWTRLSSVTEPMTFRGSLSDHNNSNLVTHCKRKSDIDNQIPAKHFITEEKMAAHLSGLHISNEFVSHDNVAECTQNSLSDVAMDSDFEFSIPMTTKELQERLKNANGITISEEVKKMTAENNVIPQALISRFEKSCTALVLWKPPQNLCNLIVPKSSTDNEEDEEEDNNNLLQVDLNTMDLDS